MADLRKSLGTLLICGFDGVVLPQHFSAALEQQTLGGLILFARNYESSDKLKKLTALVQLLQHHNHFPVMNTC